MESTSQSQPEQPKDETPVEPSSEAQTETPPIVPSQKPKPTKGRLIGIAVSSILAFGGIAFGIYGMTHRKVVTVEKNPYGSTNSYDTRDSIVILPDSDTSEEAGTNVIDVGTNNRTETTSEGTIEIRSISYLGELECYIANSNDDYCTIPPSKIVNDSGNTVYHIFPVNNPESLSSNQIGNIEKSGGNYVITIQDDIYPGAGDNRTTTVSFEQNVRKYGIGGYGQAVGDECAFFVMEDGSIYFVKLEEIASNQAEVKKIDEVENAVTLMSGGTCTYVDNERGFGGCGHNTYAIRADGRAYTLFSYVR